MNAISLEALRSLFTPAVAAVLAALMPGCVPSAEQAGGSPVNATRPAPDQSRPHSASRTGQEAVVIEGDISAVDWRSLVGQTVSIPNELVVVDTHDLLRWGEVKVARDRLFVPTNYIDPNDADPAGTSSSGGSNVAEVTAAQQRNDNATIALDDGFTDQNFFPPRLFSELGAGLATVRIGSTVEGVTGEVQTRGKTIVLVPDAPLSWTPAERPARPALGEPSITVAGFNVLNYFTTIDNEQNDARGADSPAELARQEAKLVAAILAMQADVIGLMELENNKDAEQRLVAALNSQPGKHRFQACGLPADFRAAPGGSDAIRVGIIYRSDRVSPKGDVGVIVDDAFGQARAPLMQTFTTVSSARPFTVIVNHFKSKGGSDEADEANKDRGDGQGAHNAVRRSQALAICDAIEQLQQPQPDARVLVLGDFNAYAQEDPLDALRAAGLVDLQERFGHEGKDGRREYSYIYYGQGGSLDHAFATESMAADITGIATWHINADEPRALDYNQEYNPEPLYEATPFRSSDHDPVLIGIAQ